MGEDTKSVAWVVAVSIVAMVVISIVVLAFGRLANPFAEETRRKTQIESQAYQDGMATDLDSLCREWRINPDPMVKATLADTIRLRSSKYSGNLPAHVEVCINEVR